MKKLKGIKKIDNHIHVIYDAGLPNGQVLHRYFCHGKLFSAIYSNEMNISFCIRKNERGLLLFYR